MIKPDRKSLNPIKRPVIKAIWQEGEAIGI